MITIGRRLVWNDTELTDDEPILTAHNRMRLGECVFNTILAVDGKLINADLHTERLLRNAPLFFKDAYLPEPYELSKAAALLLEKNKYMTGRYAVNMIISREDEAGGLKASENAKLKITMRALPVPETFPLLRVIIAIGVKRNEGSPLSNIKCGNYGDSLMALKEAESAGANDAILMNNRNNVACATSSNIFILEGGRLATPPLADGAQEGVIRELVIKRLGAVEKRMTQQDLMNAEGIYLTNSIRGAQVVKTLNGRPMPDPGLKIPNDFHLS